MSYLITLGRTLGSLRYARDLIEHKGLCTTVRWWGLSPPQHEVTTPIFDQPDPASFIVDYERANSEERK